MSSKSHPPAVRTAAGDGPSRKSRVGLGRAVLGVFLGTILFGLVIGAILWWTRPQGRSVVTTTQVEEASHHDDLSGIDIGADPTLQLNVNVDRIEDVSVPGPVDPQAAGIPNAPESMRQNTPAPPGVGGG